MPANICQKAGINSDLHGSRASKELGGATICELVVAKLAPELLVVNK